MGVSVSIELEQLRNPAVSRALADLMLALGRVAPEAVESPAAPPADGGRRGKPRKSPTRRSTPKPLSGTQAQRYATFFAKLPERSQRFLELVEERGLLTIGEAMKALDITVPKAMGGITGSIGRWAPVRGVKVPYTAVTHKGQRAWRWTGSESSGGGEDAKEGDLETGASVEALIAELPEDSARFMRLLQERKELAMPDVLSLFNLARAKAVGGIIEPISRVGREQGIENPYVAAINDQGERTWRWPGYEPPAEPEAPPAPSKKAPSAGRPGVRVRKARK